MALKQLCAAAYGKNKHPALFQNPQFMALAAQAAKLGMTIKLGDIKSSRGPIPEKVKTEHARELAVYNLDLGPAVVAGWLHNLFPAQTFSIFELLQHPLVQALKENFIFYFGYQLSDNYQIIPQIAERTAFTRQAADKLRKRFTRLMHQINNSMLIRHVRQTQNFIAGDDDMPLPEENG
jgi:hypothetical protein